MEPWRTADDHNREAWRLKMGIGGWTGRSRFASFLWVSKNSREKPDTATQLSEKSDPDPYISDADLQPG